MTSTTQIAATPAAPSGAAGGLARSGAISFVGAVCAAALGFALTVVVGRTLGPVGAGLFFTVAALFFIVSNAVELGADTALVWALPRLRALGRSSEFRSTVRIALVPVWLVSALSGIGLFVLAPQLAALLVEPAQEAEGVRLLRVVAPFLAVAAPLAVALAGTRGLGSVLPFALVGNIGVPLARPLLVLLAVAVGAGTVGVLFAWAAPLAVATAVALLVLGRQLRGAERAASGLPARPVREQVREFWGYATPRCFSAILEIALVWTDVLLVAALASTRAAGIYATASRFITTGTLVEGALRVALGPRLSEQLAVGDRRGAERLQETAGVCIVALSWPIYLVLAVFSPFLLRLFGEDFVEGAVALTVLALAMGLSQAAGLAQTVLLMSGASGWQLANKVVALALNVVLNLLLVPRFGIEGAAIAWTVAILFDGFAALVQVRLVLGLRVRLRRVVLVAVAAVECFGLLGLLVRVLLGTDLVALVVHLGLACPLYAAVLYALRRQLRIDDVVRGLLQRRNARSER